MELEEMKSLWTGMSEELKKQQKLTDQLILQMTSQKFRSKLNWIATFESGGAVICFAIAAYVAANFRVLDTWYLVGSGVFTILFYLIAPVISLTTVYRMKNLEISRQSIKDTIVEFARRKQQFLLAQRLLIYLTFLLVILGLPVAAMIMDGKDLFLDPKVWYWYIPISFLALFLFTRWGFRGYKKMVNSSERILRQLDGEESGFQ